VGGAATKVFDKDSRHEPSLRGERIGAMTAVWEQVSV
jgi:hypothetical protein